MGTVDPADHRAPRPSRRIGGMPDGEAEAPEGGSSGGRDRHQNRQA